MHVWYWTSASTATARSWAETLALELPIFQTTCTIIQRENQKSCYFLIQLRKLRARGLTTLGYIWQRLATLGYVWQRADTLDYIWKRVNMLHYVWLHSGAVWHQFGNIWQHFTSNWIQLAMFWQQTWKTTPLWVIFSLAAGGSTI